MVPCGYLAYDRRPTGSVKDGLKDEGHSARDRPFVWKAIVASQVAVARPRMADLHDRLGSRRATATKI
jgi:hypothetical protein